MVHHSIIDMADANPDILSPRPTYKVHVKGLREGEYALLGIHRQPCKITNILYSPTRALGHSNVTITRVGIFAL